MSTGRNSSIDGYDRPVRNVRCAIGCSGCQVDSSAFEATVATGGRSTSLACTPPLPNVLDASPDEPSRATIRKAAYNPIEIATHVNATLNSRDRKSSGALIDPKGEAITEVAVGMKG